jgi:hypothetical protein
MGKGMTPGPHMAAVVERMMLRIAMRERSSALLGLA